MGGGERERDERGGVREREREGEGGGREREGEREGERERERARARARYECTTLTCKKPGFPRHISTGACRLLVWRCGTSEPVSSTER